MKRPEDKLLALAGATDIPSRGKTIRYDSKMDEFRADHHRLRSGLCSSEKTMHEIRYIMINDCHFAVAKNKEYGERAERGQRFNCISVW